MQIETTETADARARPHLTRKLILETALQLVDREGQDGLSMRRLAAELGAAPMAIYSHFRDKAELEAALVDAVTGEIELPDADDESPWREQLLRIGLEYRRVLLAHPGMVPLCTQERAIGANTLRAWERIISLLSRSGLDPISIAHVMNCSYAFIVGHVILETSRMPELGHEAEASVGNRKQAKVQLVLETLSVTEHPGIVEMAPYFLECVGDEYFETGLRRLLLGFEAASAGAATAGAGGGEGAATRSPSGRRPGATGKG
jgi:AcrR family transcriptional regulator